MKEFPLNLSPGAPSQRFFVHFNALLADHQRSAHGTVQSQKDGGSEAITVGQYLIDGSERRIEWRLRTSPNAAVVSLAVSCETIDQANVSKFAEEMVRIALANALSHKRNKYFFRRVVSYVGPVLSGEYWLPGFRFGAAVPSEDIAIRYRVDMERLVTLDFDVWAVDGHQAAVLAGQNEIRLLQMLSLLLRVEFTRIPHEWVWVISDTDGPELKSERRCRGFYEPSLSISEMPRKGSTHELGEYAGSVSDYFRGGASTLLTLPTEARGLFRALATAPSPEAFALDACARMYRLSLVLARYSQSASLAYQVAAIDSIVNALRPKIESIPDFLREYCPTFDISDEFVDFIYGTIRSSHFHAGSAPLDIEDYVPFHPLLDPFRAESATLGFEARLLIHAAIGAWLREVAEAN